MRTCAAKEVFHGIWRGLGLDPLVAELSPAQKARTAELVMDRLREGWQDTLNRELLVVEERQFRPDWAAGTTYAAGAEVLGSDEVYYVSQAWANVGHDPTTDDGTWWAEVVTTEFVKDIDLAASGETVIDGFDLEGVAFASDPRVDAGLAPITPVVLMGSELLVQGSCPAKVWLVFRPECPVVSWTEWRDDRTYAVGDVVFVGSYQGVSRGTCWRAVAGSTNEHPLEDDGTKWVEVGFPLLLKKYVVAAVQGDMTTEDEARGRLTGEAERELEKVKERGFEQRGVVRRARWSR